MGPFPLTEFQRNPSSHSRDTEKGHICMCARANVQMYHTHDLYNMLLCIATSSPNANQIWSLSAVAFLSYNLVVNFDTLYAARATCEDVPPNEPNQIGLKQLMTQAVSGRLESIQLMTQAAFQELIQNQLMAQVDSQVLVQINS